MMKTPLLPRLALPLVLLAALPAFRPAALTPTGIVADETAREVRQVGEFTRLSLATSAEVILTQGATRKVEVVGNPEDLKELETTVKDGRLRIGTTERNWSNWRGFKNSVKVYVTMPTINALDVSGSGSLRADQPVRATSLDLSVSGSGRLQVPVTAESAKVSLSGSGQVKLSGTSPKLAVSVSGSGRVDATELQAQDATVGISGSGGCRLKVADTLSANISGSGSVYYAGSPRVSSRVSGSGRVVKG